MQILKMDFQSQSAPPVVPVVQQDSKSRFIGIALYDGGVPYEAPENVTYTVQYHGPGPNNIGWYDTICIGDDSHAAVTVDSNSKHIVTLELAEQALRTSGDVRVNLCAMTDTGYMLRTFDIIARVNAAAYPEPAAVASYFYVVNLKSVQWLEWVTACQEAQRKADLAAESAASDAAAAQKEARSSASSAAESKASASKSKEYAAEAKAYSDDVKQKIEDTLQDYTGGYYRSYTLTLPAGSWEALPQPIGIYGYACSVPVEGCTSNMIPFAAPEMTDADTAAAARMAGVVQTLDGSVCFFAASPAAEDIHMLLTLLAKGSAAADPASKETLGLVQVGDNINVTSKGVISTAVASDDEITALMQDIFKE